MTNTNRYLAAVTGASDGLGKEFARQLAGQGYDLLLIARRKNLLDELKADLEKQYGITAESVVCDLSNAEELKKLEDRIEHEERLEVFVNNAGFGITDTFPNVDPDKEESMIRLHCIALMRLSRAALVPMCKRKKGYLVNLASISSFLRGPNTVEYSATKTYVLAFSQSLQCDVRHCGVRVQALCPGLTHTGFHSAEGMKDFDKAATPNFLWLTAEYVVRTSLRSIKRSRKVVCVPSLRYKLLLLLLCNPIGDKIMEMVYRSRLK
ncbi:MAG: SDR family oxidoreductase [Planctomycetaceae bacterium]|jgi:short-subunit dehydrogenase|nr:SDR family oxidoreductase [Planctomycetaceae bacterium]